MNDLNHRTVPTLNPSPSNGDTYTDAPLHVPTVDVNWWVVPDEWELVDSFDEGLEVLPLTYSLSIRPFEKYGLWWFVEYIDDVFECTHGPYEDEESAIGAGMNLVQEVM